MKRLIDAYSAKEALEYTLVGDSASMAERVIDSQPTVDAVPVVRCKDCARCITHKGVHICNKWRTFQEVELDGFCSYGEKEGSDNE